MFRTFMIELRRRTGSRSAAQRATIRVRSSGCDTCRSNAPFPAPTHGGSRLFIGSRLVDLPGRGGNVGLEAQPTDDLLQSRVVALGGDGLRGHRHLGGVGNVLAVETAQS